MRRLAIRRIAVASLLVTQTLGGCSFLKPRPDPTRFYVLVPTAPAPDEALAIPARGTSFGLGPVSIPDYLKRPTIVTRTSDTQIQPSSVDRWGEPIEGAVTRVVQENLRRLLGVEQVRLYPWYSNDRPTVQARVHVLRLERDPEGRAHLEALWEIRDPATGNVVNAGETRVVRDPEAAGMAGSIAAESAALGDLSRDMATALAVAVTPRAGARRGRDR